MTEKTGKEIAELLTDWVNNMNLDNKEFVETICYKTHRTLQQSLFKVMVGLMKEWAKCSEENNFDLRNEATVNLCKEINDKFGERFYLPFI